MKTYKFELIIKEQSDEFWEDITKDNKSGCDEIIELVNEILGNSNLSFDVKLINFIDK